MPNIDEKGTTKVFSDMTEEQMEKLHNKLKGWGINNCPICNRKLVNAMDRRTGKISRYLWKCPKGCMGRKVLSKG